MDRETELEQLFRNAIWLVDRSGALPPIARLMNPTAQAGNWARSNPDKAYQLASDICDLLNRYFASLR